MAEANISIDQNQFNCSICLDLLNDPVTISCGHSFCVLCINGFWDQGKEKEVYSCPQCRETFTLRPVLRRNNVMSEVVDKLKKTKPKTSSPILELICSEVEDVDCDFCLGEKNKAVKSCLTCLASFCEDHIQPHYEFSAFKKHKVVMALNNLQEKICSQHDKLLEVFCRTDQRGICYECLRSEHKDHNTVLAEEEWMDKKKLLKDLQKKSNEKLRTTEDRIKELTQGTEFFKLSAQAALEANERICDEMIQCIEKKRFQVRELIKAQEKAELDRSAELLMQLEQKISDLKQKSDQLEMLLLREDQIQFIQAFQSFSNSIESNDKLRFTVNTQFTFDDIASTLSGLKHLLEENSNLQVMSDTLSYSEIVSLPEPTREDFLKYSHKALLDPNTACLRLYLTEENTVAERKVQLQTLPDIPERFDFFCQVLCQESLSRRFYFEVEWTGINGVTIGVSYKGIVRKGSNLHSRLGYNNQSWGLFCSQLDFYCIHNGNTIRIFNPKSNRIGVYVDHRAGILSYFSISDKVTPIHTFQTKFSHPLYPCFWVGEYSTIKLCDPK